MKRAAFVVVAVASCALVRCAGAPPKAEEKQTAPAPASAPATPGSSGSGTSAPAKVAEVAPEPVPASEQWRAAAPKPGAVPSLIIPTVQQATLPNGLTILVSEQHQLPFVSVQAAIRAGASLDPEGKAGLAGLVYEMLPEGAGKRDAVALADAFGDLGCRLGASAGDDGGTLQFAVLSRNVDPAVALLAEVIQKPRFEAKDFDKRKKKVLADLVRSLGEPMYLAFDAAAGEIFGAKHPYGHSADGTMASVSVLKVDDVKKFYAANVGPKTTALVFAGDITLAEAKKVAQKHLGKWQGKAKPPKAPAAPSVGARGKVVVVAKPGLEQTVLAAGRPAIARGDADEWPLELATSVFGGMFTSRLNMNLREDKGITYGAFGWLDAKCGVGLMGAGSPVDAKATGVAVKELFKEVDGMTSRPITDAEFAQARDNYLRSLPGMFETCESLSGSIGNIFITAQPLDRWQRMAVALDKLKVEDVRAAAKKYYDPKLLKLVLVGDPTAISEQIKDQNLGPIEVREPAIMALPK